MKTYDLIVVGEGMSGLTCANHTARAGLGVATFEAELFGGLVLNVAELEGFDEGGGASGMDLASELALANGKLGVQSVQDEVVSIRPGDGGFEVEAGGAIVGARAVVVASGARLRRLGVPGEARLDGKGVSRCADCDGPLFRDREVVVVGGGDSAFQEALVLARDCATVHLIHDGPRPTAKARFLEAAATEPKIRTIADSTVEAILGERAVTGVRVRPARDVSFELGCAGVFPYIGLEPNAGFVPASVPRDAAGYLVTDEALETVVFNLWVIGQARAGFGGTLRDAVSEAERTAKAVRARLD